MAAAWYWLGETRRRRGDEGGALEALDRAARLDLRVFQDPNLRDAFEAQLRAEAAIDDSEAEPASNDDDSRP